jgi:hypothetical protein
LSGALVVNVLKDGRGPLATAAFAVLLMILGAVIAPELAAGVDVARRRVLGGRTSSLGRLLSPKQVAARLPKTIDRGGVWEPAVAQLRDALDRQCDNVDSDRLTLIVGEKKLATRVVHAAFESADGFQCLEPSSSASMLRWLKDHDADLPAAHDPHKATVVLLGDFAKCHELGVEPAAFARWRGSNFVALGWLERLAGRAGWFDTFVPVAYVIDIARAARRHQR